MPGSRTTATRVTRGAISLSNSSHFALMPYSNAVKPVTLPPGRARLATKPAPTGSITCTNTIGTVRVACCNAATVGLAVARITSGASATNSAAYLRLRSISTAPQRMSIRTLRPSVQPDCCSPCKNAAKRRCPILIVRVASSSARRCAASARPAARARRAATPPPRRRAT